MSQRGGGAWSARGVFLALETSGSLGSVAISRGASVLARAWLPNPREQASAVLPAINSCLREVGLALREVRGVVVGAGPGSFTGVRVAAATAKGLSHALGVPLWAVSSLAAAALTDRVLTPSAVLEAISGEISSDPSSIRYVLFDARGDRVYAACYRVADDGGGVHEVVPSSATLLGTLLDGPVPGGAVFVGEGAVRHAERVRQAGYKVIPGPAGVPTADALLHLLANGSSGEPLRDPAGWEPEYLKAEGAPW